MFQHHLCQCCTIILISQPENEPLVSDLKTCTSECPPKNKGVLESRSSVENCAKNLFSSPGTKRGFTRHPSLIKMAKRIQDDRRKINSAPSSPAKTSLGQHIKPSSEDNVVLFLKGVITPNVKSHPAFLQVIHRASTSRANWPNLLLSVRRNSTRSPRKFGSVQTLIQREICGFQRSL